MPDDLSSLALGNLHSGRYVAECHELTQQSDAPDVRTEPDAAEPTGPPCPTCGGDLERLEHVHRTSWRDIFSGSDCPRWYTFREAPG